MKILRIEAVLGERAGDGPYHAIPDGFDPTESHHANAYTTAFYDGGDALYSMAGRPTPDMDGIGSMFSDEVCGFSSPGQLLAWFPPRQLRTLTSTGYYSVVAYDVPDHRVRHGRHQVVFPRGAGYSKEHVPLDVLISSEQPTRSGRTSQMSEARS